MRFCRLAACALLLSVATAPAAAASVSATFPVTITLSQTGSGGVPVAADPPASGTCTNQTLSQATHATVTVVCSDNQFVSIAALPGTPFIGTHGGAFRYLMPSGSALVTDGDPVWQTGVGTITTLQIRHIRIDQWDFTEIQVSY